MENFLHMGPQARDTVPENIICLTKNVDNFLKIIILLFTGHFWGVFVDVLPQIGIYLS